jgi:hypothetical protein
MGRAKGSGPTPGSFKKGDKANPKGRPKIDKVLRAEAQRDALKLIKRLKKFALDQTLDPEVCMKAIDHVLNRGFGRPEQGVKHSGDADNPVVNEHTVYIATGVNRKATTEQEEDTEGNS